MPVAKKTTENKQTDAPETPAPTIRTRTPSIRTGFIPKGEADVTVKYRADVDDNEQTKDNQNKNNIPANAFPFANQKFFETPQIPRNSLAFIADVLAQDGQENYLAVITRKKDYPTDKFNYPCFSDRNFPEPIPITPKEVLLHLSGYLLRLNENSGGRFNIYFCDAENAEMVEDAYLSNFEINNPPKVETSSNNQDNNLQLLQMFEQIQARSDERFAQLLQNLKPEKDRFTELAETFLMKKLTEETPANQNFDSSSVIKSIFESQAVIQTLSEQMAGAFGNNNAPEKPIYLQLAESDAGKVIAEKGVNLLEKIAAIVAMRQANQSAPNPQVIVEQSPPQSPQPQLTPEQVEQMQREQEQQIINMENFIDGVIEILDKDAPLNKENEDLQVMIDSYPAIYPLIAMACKAQDFETVLNSLNELVPETFAEYKDESGEYNKKGEKLKTRLKEFYDFVREN